MFVGGMRVFPSAQNLGDQKLKSETSKAAKPTSRGWLIGILEPFFSALFVAFFVKRSHTSRGRWLVGVVEPHSLFSGNCTFSRRCKLIQCGLSKTWRLWLDFDFDALGFDFYWITVEFGYMSNVQLTSDIVGLFEVNFPIWSFLLQRALESLKV